MSIEISDVSATRKQCVVVYPFDEFQKDYQNKVRNFRGQVPGFRAGKVPRHVIEKRCGLGFRQELVDNKMRNVWKEITNQHQPLGSPEINIEPEDLFSAPVAEQKDINMTLVFDVPPSITPFSLDQWGLSLEAIPAVTAEERQDYLSHLARQNGEEVLSDAAAKKGNVVHADITYAEDGRTEEGLRLILDDKEIHPEFVKQLTGKKVGDECSFEYTPISYDEGKSDKETEQKPLSVKVVLKTVATLEPASDEKLYEKLVPEEKFDENKWQELVSKNLDDQAYKNHFKANEQKVLEYFLTLHDIEIPQAHYEGKEFATDAEKADFEKSVRQDYLLERYGRFLDVKMPQDAVNFFAELFCDESNIPLPLFQHFVRSEKQFQQQFYTMVSQRMVTKNIIDALTAKADDAKVIATPTAEKKAAVPKKAKESAEKAPAVKKAAPKKEKAPEEKAEKKQAAPKKEKAPTAKKAEPKKSDKAAE